MARILVGIPTYNRPDYVRETVRSVLEQTTDDYRILISDNASEDGAAAAVARFVEELRDPRVSYHLQPTNGMEYGQGRFLFGECREEFFTILHDDDLLMPEFLETAVRRLDENPALDVFVADPTVIDSSGAVSEAMTRRYLAEHGRSNYRQGPIPILEPLMRHGTPPISGTFFRTSALRESGYVDDGIGGSYPFEFNVLLRLGERRARAWYCKRPLVRFRFHGDSGRVANPLVYDERAVMSMLELLEPRRFSGVEERLRRRIVAFTRRRQAMILLARGEVAAARRRLVGAVRLNPLSYRNWLFAAGVLAVPSVLRPHFAAKARLLPDDPDSDSHTRPHDRGASQDPGVRRST